MSQYISGVLVKDSDLERVTKLKAKSIKEKTVDKPLALKYKEQNWIVKKEYGKTLRIYKNKTPDELFEDEIWLLFKKMGFKEMNEDRQLRIGIGADSMQIDVFAKDDNHIILIECKTAEKPAEKDLSKDIREILQTKKEMIKALKEYYGKYYQPIFFLITKNIILSETDKKLAQENIEKDFFLWTEKETQPFMTMAEDYKDNARIIMYSNIFRNRKVLERIQVPAIRGGKGKNKYYYFVIQPAKLLSGVAYIHRREETNPEEISFTYQRMLNTTKLERIKEYVQNGGFFANNIIMNFTKKPIFDQQGNVEDIVQGTLTLPREYGSAWIIDGQHRLYSYLGSGKSEDTYIPVLAFDNMPVMVQAKLFVDINKEQKPVSDALLWDLYSDLYADSTDTKQQELRAISKISKKLNFDKNSPLYQLIELPSQSKDIQKKAHLLLTRICVAINENRLIREEENLLFDENYDKTIETAFEVLKDYLNIISKSYFEDWQKAEKGLLCSNVGIRILINILRQLLKFLIFYEDKNIYLSKDKERFNKKTIEILNPVIDKIKNLTQDERDEISDQTKREQIVENTQKLLWDIKESKNFGIELWKNGGWTPGIPENESDEKISKMIDETEAKIQSFIVKELKLLYKENWWKKGIPSDTEKYIMENLIKDTKMSPWKKDMSITLPDEEKLRYISTSHLKDLILKKDNWQQFERYFAKNKEIVSTAFGFFSDLRVKLRHTGRDKDLDDIEKGLGYWNMKWIRRCIGLDQPTTL